MIHNYIITRFSILDYTFKGYRLTIDQTEEDYKNILFDKNRLDFKFNVFEKMTLSSIMNQTSNNYTWLIYTSIYLPDEYKTELINLVKSNKNIKIIYVNTFKEFFDDINKQIIHDEYTTIRLDDDDDGLNNRFIETLNNYNYNDMKNKILSFPKGKKFKVDNNIIFGNNIKYLNIALGLTAFNMNIYKCGDHTKINDKYDVIYNNDIEEAYYVCCSEYCDKKKNIIIMHFYLMHLIYPTLFYNLHHYISLLVPSLFQNLNYLYFYIYDKLETLHPIHF